MKLFKRSVSILLAALMAFSEPMFTLADALDDTAQYISGSRIEDIPEGDYVYMGTSSVDMQEGNGLFSVPIYREGDLSKRASVTIHTMDFSAVYGKDYKLEGKHKKEYRGNQTILELIAKGDDDVSPETQDFEVNVKTATDTELHSGDSIVTGITRTGTTKLNEDEFLEGIKEAEDVIYAPKQATPTEYEDEDEEEAEPSEAYVIDNSSDTDSSADEELSDDGDSEAGGMSELAKLKYAQTGVPTREGTASEINTTQDIMQQLIGAISPEYMSQIPYSAEQTIYFEPEESEAYVTFRLYDNKKSDGARSFTITIVDTSDNIETYQYNSTSVVIEDDEETDPSRISFSQQTFTADNNIAQVIVKRENFESSLATARLYATNQDTEEEEVLGELVFLPYETEKKVQISLGHDTTIRLDDFTAAKAGDISDAVITGTGNSSEDYSNYVVTDDDIEAYYEGVDGSDSESTISTASTDDESSIALTADNALAAAASNSDIRSFTITLSKGAAEQKEYTVQYSKGDMVGKIYDTGYNPWVEVGEYYFQTDINYGGLFQYRPWTLAGDEPDIGVYEAKYNISDADKNDQRWERGFGETKYYSWAVWHRGEVWFGMPLNRKGINPFWYQYIMPQMAETSSFGCSDQISEFRLGPSWHYKLPTTTSNKRYTRRKGGEFSNGFYNELAVKITDDREGLYARIAAKKECGDTPKCYTEFRGMAAMYKWYEVTVRAGLNLSFRAGGTTIDALPAQIKAKCGAQMLYANDSRAVYTTNGGSDMVFSLQPNTVNGSIDKFGELSGYTIRVGGSDPKNSKTVNYPEDYVSFLKYKLTKKQAYGSFGMRKLYPLSTDCITYNASTVNAKLLSIYDHLDTIRFDEYFIDWINSLGAGTYNDGIITSNGENAAWHQGLEFTPKFKYVDVNVKITAANIEGDGLKEGIAEFTDSELKEGTTKTYHAGDMLDLSVKSKSDDYTVVGYEVSTDGGITFDTIRSTNTLLLGTGNVNGYIIRPCVTTKSNWVEINIGNFTDKLHVANVIPQEDLKDYPELKGRYFLDINPNAEDIYERMRPEVGKAYSIDVLVDETNEKKSGWGALSPQVTDRMTGRTYYTNKYYFIARKTRSDNSFTVTGTLQQKSHYTDYTLTGTVVTKGRSIVNDGLGLHNIPVTGYQVQLGAEQAERTDAATGETNAYVDTVSASVGEDGTFTISGKAGSFGEYINILIDNGVNDAQVVDIKLALQKSGDTYTQDVGQLVLSYPENAPKITSIAYDYDKSESRSKADLTQNSVRCFDDNLLLTANVDTKGRKIDKVVFVVKSTLGSTETYEPEEKGSSESTAVFQATIKDMLKRLHNGDRVYAYIVDKETRRISVGRKYQKMEITYPTVDTGLVMYVENELIKPKNLEINNDPMRTYDIPIIGETASNAKSGVLSFTRTNYPNNNGYQLVVNLDMILKAYNPDPKEKVKAAQKIYSDLKEKDEKISAAALELVNDEESDSGSIDDDDLNINDADDRDANINLADDDKADKGTQTVEKFDEVRGENLANSGLNKDINGLETNEQLSKKYGGQDAGSSKATAFNNNQTKITGSAFVTIVMQYVLNPVTQQYIMFSAACTIGGMVTINKTWYTLCYAIPFYFNLTGTGQINFYGGGLSENAQTAITEGDFNNTSGNIQKYMTIGNKCYGGAEFICKVKGQVGAGICGIFGARGFVQVGFDVLGMQYQGLKDKSFGMAVGIAGGIGIDLVVISVDIPFASVNKGFGLFEKKTGVTFLGVDADSRSANARLASDGDYDGTVLFGVPTDEYGNPIYEAASVNEEYAEDESGSETDALSLTAADEASEGTEPVVRYYKLGADIEDSFVADDNEVSLLDGLFGATPEVDEIIPLQENAAEHTRPQLINLDDNGDKQLLVFLGKGQDTKGNATSCLYYTVKNGSKWSEPQPVNTDLSGTCKTNYDTSPCIARYDDTIMVVWMDAREPVMGNAADNADFKDKYLKFNVTARLFDTDGKPSVDTITLHSDAETYKNDAKKQFFNMEPNVTVSDDHAYVTYLKRDISSAKTEQDLLDLKGIYCTTALVSYNFKTGVKDSERLIDLHWDGAKADPLVTDCEVQGFKLESNKDSSTPVKEHDDKDYLAAVYTVDADEDLSSGTDRELYLVIYDITDKLQYYPIRLTNDEAVQSSPKLNLINGKVYLTWLNNTDNDADEELKLMNVSEFTENMLYTKTVSDRYDAPDRENEEEGVNLTSIDTATPSELKKTLKTFAVGNTATPTEAVREELVKRTATPSEYSDVIRTASAAAKDTSINILNQLKLSNSSVFTIGAAGRVDPYYSSGWKEINGTDWLISGNDWYKSSVEDADMKAALQSSLSEYFNIKVDGEAAYPGYDSIKDESYADDYAVSVFGRVANYDLPVYTAVLTRDDSIGEYSLGEYKLAGDGTNVYVFFADFCDDTSHTGKELYAMRFRESDDDGDGVTNHGFTKPVMLTDEDAVIDEFAVVANADETVNIAANMYSQNINSNNQLVYGANTLVYMDFKAVGSIEPDSESIEFSKSIKKGEQTETSFVIKNNGLYTSEGCDLKVELIDSNGKVKQNIKLSDDLAEYLDDIKLEPGEETKLSIIWTPDIELDGTYLRITVSEKTSIFVSSREYTAETAVPYDADVDFISSDVSFDGEKLTITAKLHNTGNKDLDELYVALKHEGASTDGGTELQRSFISGGLKAGEQKEVTFTYTPKASDFSSLGRIEFKLSAVSDGEEVAAQYDNYQSTTPVVTELEDGAEHIAVAVGESKTLKTYAAPWGELAGTPQFSSSDGTVAYVDEAGVLHALQDGTVTITVYYPKLAVSDTIRIIVGTGVKKEETSKRQTSHRNSDRYKSSAADSTILAGRGIPSGAINGTWNYDPAAGKWSFTAGGRQYKSEWAYVYNPYATELQAKADWFRFDDAGYMVTGWFDDTDGNRYFLWPLSDNSMGHMVTGWLKIGTKWYCFKTVSDGTRGALLRGTTTPDGYKVDAEGVWTGEVA